MLVLLESCQRGGELQVKIRGQVKTVEWEPGDAILFPAKYLEHRVGKCKVGTRQSLVAWIS